MAPGAGRRRCTGSCSHALPRPLTVMLAPRPPAGLDVETADPHRAGAGGSRVHRLTCRRSRAVWAKSAGPRSRRGSPGPWVWRGGRSSLQAATRSTVVPAMLEPAESAVGRGARRRRGAVSASGPGAQVEQLRDYRPGDPLRVIDWRATARRRQLVSRDFAEDQHLDVMVALDVGPQQPHPVRRAGSAWATT